MWFPGKVHLRTLNGGSRRAKGLEPMLEVVKAKRRVVELLREEAIRGSRVPRAEVEVEEEGRRRNGKPRLFTTKCAKPESMSRSVLDLYVMVKRVFKQFTTETEVSHNSTLLSCCDIQGYDSSKLLSLI